MLLLRLWQPSRLRRLLEWVRRAVNHVGGWFRRPSWLWEDWAERNAAQFTSAALEIAAHPCQLNRPLLIALLAHPIDLTSLYADSGDDFVWDHLRDFLGRRLPRRAPRE